MFLETHAQKLRKVFQLCRKHNVKLNLEIYSFFTHGVAFLDYKYTYKGRLPDDSKYDVIKKYPILTDPDGARRFVATFETLYLRTTFSSKIRSQTISLFSIRSLSSMFTRLRLDFEKYDFTVEYLKRKDNYIANALSSTTIKELEEMNIKTVMIITRWLHMRKVLAKVK